MEDAHLVAAVAERLIRRYGSNSLGAIAELREKALALGDKPSAQTWCGIAAAAEHLLAGELEAFATQSQTRPILDEVSNDVKATAIECV